MTCLIKMSSYTCSICNYSTNTKGNINKHIKNKCLSADIIEKIVEVCCDICDKKFNTEVLLKQHKKSCIEKRTLVVKEYINKEELDEEMKMLKTIIKSLKNDNHILNNQVQELVKRIEKLEDKKRSKDIEGKIEEDDLCQYMKKIMFVPIDYEYTKNMQKKCNNDDDIVQVTITGQRSNVLEGFVEKTYIEVENVKYCYDKDIAKRDKQKWAGELKVILYKYCEENAQNITENGKYCDEHIH